MASFKKLFSISTPERRNIIENATQDRAAVNGCTTSSVIEHFLMSAILPKNADAAAWVSALYNDIENPSALGIAYYRAFAHLAAGNSWEALHQNALPLVECLRDTLFLAAPNISGNEREWYHLREQWSGICDYLSTIYPDSDWGFARELLNQIEKPKMRCYPLIADCITYIIGNWGQLNNYTRTYRALCDLSLIAIPANVAKHRCTYCDTLSRISADWG